MTSSDPQYFFPRPPFVGREAERAILRDGAGKPAVFYVVGEGGLGKSWVLQDFLDWVKGEAVLLETGIIDLQQAHYLQPVLLLDGLVRRLKTSFKRLGGDPEAIFQHYRVEMERYVKRLADRSAITSSTANLERAFLQDYAALSSQTPIVVILDTFERLQPDIPEVRAFNFLQERRLETWLISLIRQLPASTIIVSGRPRPDQSRLLKTSLGKKLRTLRLKPFGEDETEQYLASVAPALTPQARSLHHCSGGRPVLLALALAVALLQGRRGGSWVLPVELEDSYPDNKEALSNLFVNSVLRDINQDRPDILDMLTKATYLRRNLDTRLIQHLDGDSEELVAERAREFCRLPFVKLIDQKGNDWRFALHDEVVELLFARLSMAGLRPWYNETIKLLEAQRERLPAATSIGVLQQRHTLTANIIFYQMARDPLEGYNNLRELFETVIDFRDLDFDVQLQDELARFFEQGTVWGAYYRDQLADEGLSWEEVVCEEAVRWARRRIRAPGSQRYVEAHQMLETIGQLFGQQFQNSTPLRAERTVASLEANIYIKGAQPEEIETGFTRVLDELAAILKAHPRSDPEYTRILFLQARAHNLRGFHRRLRQKIRSAIEDYRTAVRLYRELGRETDGVRAQALVNLSFALGEQGRRDEAIDCAEAARRLAESAGSTYTTALALNTLARVETLINPQRALQRVTQARELFKKQRDQRGRALCAIVEGLVRTQLAVQCGFVGADGQRHFQAGARSFALARRMFDESLQDETLRRIEARVGLGTLLRERALALVRNREDASADFVQAEAAFSQAQSLCTDATPKPVVVSILEDLAVIAEARGEYSSGLALLKEARRNVPPIYNLQEGIGITESAETREEQIFWLRLGQVELQSSLCHFGLHQHQEACFALQRAFAYLLTFSSDPRPLGTFRRLGRRELVKAPGSDHTMFASLRRETNYYASVNKVSREARAEMERVFAAADDYLNLL